jgi:DNA-binding transcriptional LysR family regulator
MRREIVRTLAGEFLVVRDLVRDGAGVGLPRFLSDPFVREGWIEMVPLTDRRTMTAI